MLRTLRRGFWTAAVFLLTLRSWGCVPDGWGCCPLSVSRMFFACRRIISPQKLVSEKPNAYFLESSVFFFVEIVVFFFFLA